jgi:hypothetical protein
MVFSFPVLNDESEMMDYERVSQITVIKKIVLVTENKFCSQRKNKEL